MKKLIYSLTALFVALTLLSTTEADGGSSLDARVNTFKAECRHQLRPFRYEGSRITYYSAQKEDVKRGIEAYMVLDTEYKFVFSGKDASTKVTLRIFDQSDEKKRTLLKEVKTIQNKIEIVSSAELSKTYLKKTKASERLKMVYLEYSIESGSTKNEAIVLVIGYKD